MKFYNSLKVKLNQIIFPAIILLIIVFFTLSLFAFIFQKKMFEKQIYDQLYLVLHSETITTYFEYQEQSLKIEANYYLKKIQSYLENVHLIKNDLSIIDIVFVDKSYNRIVHLPDESSQFNILNHIELIDNRFSETGKNQITGSIKNYTYFSVNIQDADEHSQLILVMDDPFMKNRFIFIILITSSFVIILLVHLFYQKKIKEISCTISEPIENLANHSKMVASGELVKARGKKYDIQEIDILYQCFDNMIERINESLNYIKTTNSLLENIINSTPNTIFVLNEKGDLMKINKSALKLFPESHLVENKNIFEKIQGLKKFEKAYYDVLHTQKKVFLPSEEIIYEDNFKNVDVQIYPLKTNGVSGGVILLRDNEDRKNYENQILISGKMEAIGRFSSQIAHDFNNVIGAINGYYKIISSQLEDQDIKNEFAQVIKEGKNLTKTLLNFARKEGKQLKNEVFNLYETINTTSSSIARFLPKNVIFKNYVDPSLYLDFSKTQFNQLITNLLVNASDAIEEKEGEGFIYITGEYIVLDKASHYFYSTNLTFGKYLILNFIDEGIGIKKENLNKVFDPLFTTKSEGKGTGLGLSIVYSIIHEVGGDIYISSIENYGTVIQLFIPLDKFDLFNEAMENQTRSLIKKVESAKTIVFCYQIPAIVRYLLSLKISEHSVVFMDIDSIESIDEKYFSGKNLFFFHHAEGQADTVFHNMNLKFIHKIKSLELYQNKELVIKTSGNSFVNITENEYDKLIDLLNSEK